jgi:hypothetical protein
MHPILNAAVAQQRQAELRSAANPSYASTAWRAPRASFGRRPRRRAATVADAHPLAKPTSRRVARARSTGRSGNACLLDMLGEFI